MMVFAGKKCSQEWRREFFSAQKVIKKEKQQKENQLLFVVLLSLSKLCEESDR